MQRVERGYTETFCIPATHPCLPGHFPGQPIVPGVVLLDRLAASLEQRGLGVLNSLAAVKFRAPLLPGQEAAMHLVIEHERLRFRILRDDQLLASGEGELA